MSVSNIDMILNIGHVFNIKCVVLVLINLPDLFLIITDIDDTLYPLSSGISAQTAKNIEGNE